MVRFDTKKIKEVTVAAQQKIAEKKIQLKAEAKALKAKQKEINVELLRFERLATLEAVTGQTSLKFSWDKSLKEIEDALLNKKFSIRGCGSETEKSHYYDLQYDCQLAISDIKDIQIANEDFTYIKQNILDTLAELQYLDSHDDIDVSQFILERIKDLRESFFRNTANEDEDEANNLLDEITHILTTIFILPLESDQTSLIFSWKNNDWLIAERSSLSNPGLLNWISSGVGQGLIKNIKESIEEAAKEGLSKLELNITSLGVNKLRWGSQEAFQVKNNGKPLGVIPFDPVLAAKLLEHLEFHSKFEIRDDSAGVVSINW